MSTTRKKVNPLEEIFSQYSKPIIIVLVVIALIAIFAFLLMTNGEVYDAFSGLLESFFDKANGAIDSWQPPTPKP